jgi:hypothetical protein
VRKFVPRVSPALVVAMVALFVALTGTTVAATTKLITGKQIANSSITGLDVKNKSLTPKDFKGSVRGPRGLRGLTGAAGATGPQGIQGPAGPMVDTLPSGKSLKGAWVLSGPTSTRDEFAIMYGIPLAAAPTKHFIQVGGVPPAGCTGDAANPGALPGHACFFAGYRSPNTLTISGGYNPEDGSNSATGSKYGVVLFNNTPPASTWEMSGTYAVTAS